MRGVGRALHVLVASLAGLAGAPAHAQTAAASQEQPGFTCCNFHPSGDWISDANWFIHSRIPAGTPARIVDYGEHRVGVEISGRAMTLGLDYGRRQNLREWAQRMIVAQDPKATIAGWPAAAREAIESGRVAIGMTKAQVIVAVGYPPAHATSSLDAPTWKYWYDTHGTYDVIFDGAGRVTEVAGTPSSVRFRVLAPDPVEQPTAAAAAGASGEPVQLKDLEGLLGAPGGKK
jgi:hypothetical protein